jgi:predicted nucleotidyltransferase
MVSPRSIERLADDIARLFHPRRIVLFGSYAAGTATPDSDIDLLIVMRHRGPDYAAASRIRLALDVSFPMDILVRSPAEVRRRLAMNDGFLSDIIQQGLVLHDCDDPGMGNQGRRRLRRRLHPTAIAKTQPV